MCDLGRLVEWEAGDSDELTARIKWLRAAASCLLRLLPTAAVDAMPEQEAIFVGIIDTILQNPAAAQGLLQTIQNELDEADSSDEEGPAPAAGADGRTPAYREMMRRLFDMLDTDGSNSISAKEAAAFKISLKRGCEASEEEVQGAAMLAFVRVLDTLIGLEGNEVEVGREAWNSYAPPAAWYTQAQEDIFVGIINEILENEEAVQGLLETIQDELQ
jgi:hypothetical protein